MRQDRGRFLTGDPFEPSKENAYDLNRYSYACANPVVLVDPSGQVSAALIGTEVHKEVGRRFKNQYPIPIGFQNWTTISTILEQADSGFGSGIVDGLLRKPDLTVAGDVREVFEIKPATRNNYAAGLSQLVTYLETLNLFTFFGKPWRTGRPETFDSRMSFPVAGGNYATVYRSTLGVILYSVGKTRQLEQTAEQAIEAAEKEQQEPMSAYGGAFGLPEASRTIASALNAQTAALIALTAIAGLSYAYGGR